MTVTEFLSATKPTAIDAGLLVLRAGSGVVFLAHGYGDVFGAGITANVANYRDAGIPLAALSAPFTALVQLIGGALLIIGLLTRVWAACLTCVMVGALIFVHWGEPLVLNQDGSGSGFAFIMGIASSALLLLGPGRFSLDTVLATRFAASRGDVRRSSGTTPTTNPR